MRLCLTLVHLILSLILGNLLGVASTSCLLETILVEQKISYFCTFRCSLSFVSPVVFLQLRVLYKGRFLRACFKRWNYSFYIIKWKCKNYLKFTESGRKICVQLQISSAINRLPTRHRCTSHKQPKLQCDGCDYYLLQTAPFSLTILIRYYPAA